ncbi:MAG: DUF547 domain-containing protein [Candidatus Latescibacterota bacterium]|jgi:hypothetical protein
MSRLIFALFIWPLASSLSANETKPFSHELFNQVLSTYVNDQGLVDYAGLKEDRPKLDAYIDSLRATSPQNSPQRFTNPQHALAYWINAYNASVLRGVIDAYPIDSVKDIKLFNGFFNRTEWTIGGETMTLNHIENEIIRPQFKDPRIHFVVNCGATSCPELENRAFDGETLNTRLEAAARRFANNKKHLYLKGDTLYLSKILEWYGADFDTWFPSERKNPDTRPPLINYFLPHLPSDLVQLLNTSSVQIKFSAYNWDLNELEKP